MMANLKEVIVLSKNELQLNVDAKKGDIIDLYDLDQIDMSILQKKIDQNLDQEYERRLKNIKERFEIEKQNDMRKVSGDKDIIISKLEEKLVNKEALVKKELELAYNAKINELKNRLEKSLDEKARLQKELKSEMDLAILQKESVLKDQINKLNGEIEKVRLEKKALEDVSESKKREAVLEKEKELEQTLKEKEQLIQRLTLEKTMMNIKKMGEELETWVDQEFQNHALNGFETCTWEKDNEAIKNLGESKGTKADYIFKVYATEEKKDIDLLTSVACEIKSENIVSTNKKKNADHYEKLDKDRVKKNCEYALLISELEWESTNDAPIRKVFGYDKMYMVRPQYFIVFLNIVTALGLKYKDIIKDYNFEKEQFKDSQDILEEFEQMKSDILDRSIDYIRSKVEEIVKSAESIKKEADKITEATRVVLNTHLQTVINKINQFSIKKIAKEIDKLN